MAIITQVSTSNTFNDWLNTTIEVVDTLNSLTEGGNTSTFFVNTNLEIANNLFVGGNVVVTGNITLDAIGFNDLTVAGNAVVNGSLTSGNITVTNLNVTENISQVNVTSSLNVGGNSDVYGNLTVTNNSTFENVLVSGTFNSSSSNVTVLNLSVTENVMSLNITSELNVGNNLTVYGNLNVFGNTTLTGLAGGQVTLTSDEAIINTANIGVLIGQANTEIYTYIDDTLGATANANLAVSFLAYSLIFG